MLRDDSVAGYWRGLIFAPTGGPVKPGFGLSGAVLLLDRISLPLFLVSCRLFRLAPRLPMQTLNTRSLYSTDHRFAMICFGRDDRVGDLNFPSQANIGLEWAAAARQ